MAGFGFGGGFGGLGASYPYRFGAPESNVVMSDTEFKNDLRSRLPSSTITENVNLISGNKGYTADGAAPYTSQIDRLNRESLSREFAGADQAGLDAVFKLMNNNGLVLGNGPGGPTIGQSAYSPYWGGGGSQIVGTTTSANPDYDREIAEMNRKIAARNENQAAQQQAYNWMAGSGQANGVLNADYSKPGFGQINGQTTNPYAPGSGNGADMGWTSGVYDPVNTYQSGMYGATGSPKNQWGF